MAETHVIAISGTDGIEGLGENLWDALTSWSQTQIADYRGEVDPDTNWGLPYRTEPQFPGDVVEPIEEQRAYRERILRVRFAYHFIFNRELSDDEVASIGPALDIFDKYGESVHRAELKRPSDFR